MPRNTRHHLDISTAPKGGCGKSDHRSYKEQDLGWLITFVIHAGRRHNCAASSIDRLPSQSLPNVLAPRPLRRIADAIFKLRPRPSAGDRARQRKRSIGGHAIGARAEEGSTMQRWMSVLVPRGTTDRAGSQMAGRFSRDTPVTAWRSESALMCLGVERQRARHGIPAIQCPLSRNYI
jgi:hypothetical protein